MRKSLYRILAPHGSRRDRFVWIAVVTIRKMREGPGPWLRAVKKGVYQLLPLGMQKSILKWTGQDAFFQRKRVHYAAADRGVEQPGVVSIVLPVWNQADMVSSAIDSVLAQTYAKLELIVVDDGSSDDVHTVLHRYVDDPRVRVLTQPNQGLPKALSTGFDFATGEFFTWTSADNLMHEDQLTKLVACLRERPEVAMVYADYELIDEAGEPLVGGEFHVMDRTDKNNLSVVRANRQPQNLNRYEDNFIGACFLYRGQVGRLLGDYNPELGLEDYDYWMRISRLFCIEHLGSDDVLYRYRVHDNTLSARARELKLLERAKAMMGYERERAAWQDAPLQVLADDESCAWLAECVESPDELSVFAGHVTGSDKTLLVLAPEILGGLPLDDLPSSVSLATWFASSEQVYLAHSQLRHLPVAAFTSNSDTAARLALFTRTVFRGELGSEALAMAVCHASDSTFFHMTRDHDKLRRVVPILLPTEAPLRVLFQLDSFGRGGLERVVEDLLTCLLAEGCEVGLLSLDASTAIPRLPGSVELVYLDKRDEVSYAEMLQSGGWHVVSAHASLFGVEAAKAQGVPFVQVVHNSYVWFDRDQIAAYRDADAATSAYICVSAQALGYADLRLQLDVQKMLVIENGIDVESKPEDAGRVDLRRELGLAADDFVFLQVASLQPAKAHRASVHALARLREQQPNAKLVCLGSEMNPVYAAAVRRDVAQLGLGEAVVFAGHRDDANAYYAMADAFFLPSYWEGCSLAVWEAIRAGLPLVLADVGAAREQLHHGDGSLIAPPFASMFALDAGNLSGVVRVIDDEFVTRTATAMAEVMAKGRMDKHGSLPAMADRRTMAQRHLLLLGWLRQGGRVPGIREAVARAALS